MARFRIPDDQRLAPTADEIRNKERRQIQAVLVAVAGGLLGAWVMWPSPPPPAPPAPPPPRAPQPPPEPLVKILRQWVDTEEGEVSLQVLVGSRHVRRAVFRCETRWAGTVEEYHLRAVDGAELPGGALPPGYKQVLRFTFRDRVVPQNTRCMVVEAERAIVF